MRLLEYCFLATLFQIVLLQRTPNVPPSPKELPIKKASENTAHLKQHLENKIDVNGLWDTAKAAFHYFEMADTNRDKYIDGIEIIKSLYHEHEGETVQPLQASLSDEEIEKMVDEAMQRIDLNKDGLIDFAEYTKILKINSQVPSASTTKH